MKTKQTVIAAAMIGCAATLTGEPQVLREEYGGWILRKAMDYDGRRLWGQTTINEGLEGPLDKHRTTYYMPWDELAPRPTGEDVYAHGTTYLWWRDGDDRSVTGFEWSVTFGGTWTRKPIPFEHGAPDPIGASLVWGLYRSPDMLAMSLGGFHYTAANLGASSQEIELEVDWETALGEPDQITRHGMLVEPGIMRSTAPRPKTDAYGLARGIVITRKEVQ